MIFAELQLRCLDQSAASATKKNTSGNLELNQYGKGFRKFLNKQTFQKVPAYVLNGGSRGVLLHSNRVTEKLTLLAFHCPSSFPTNAVRIPEILLVILRGKCP